MKRILKYSIFLLVIMPLINGCSEDEVAEQDFIIDASNFFQSPNDYQNALIGVYDLLGTTFWSAMIGEIASDNSLCGGENAVDVIGLQEIDDMIHTPFNENLENIWDWMYGGIDRANFIMQNKDNIDFPEKESVLAQTRFLRALYYFELAKFFDDVPLIVDRRLELGEELTIDRTPSEEVYAQIEEDLAYAAQILPAIPSQTGRVTSGAANALLGKVLLYQDKFPEAVNAFENVIGSVYELEENYNTLFENFNENNAESVFEVQYTDIQGAGFGCFQCSEGNIAVGFNGPRSYAGPLFESGFSFNLPTEEFYNAFDTSDIRRDIAILNIDQWAADTGASFTLGFEHTGYYNRKYIPRQGDLNTGDQNLTNPNNYKMIRYADVLLMAAEAYNRGNISDATARNYLNQVRSRVNLPAITDSGSDLTEAIYRERRLELAGEGHRFFDLVRTGRADQVIDGFQVGKHEFFPIPDIEIELTGNRWDNNPGYN